MLRVPVQLSACSCRSCKLIRHIDDLNPHRPAPRPPINNTLTSCPAWITPLSTLMHCLSGLLCRLLCRAVLRCAVHQSASLAMASMHGQTRAILPRMTPRASACPVGQGSTLQVAMQHAALAVHQTMASQHPMAPAKQSSASASQVSVVWAACAALKEHTGETLLLLLAAASTTMPMSVS